MAAEYQTLTAVVKFDFFIYLLWEPFQRLKILCRLLPAPAIREVELGSIAAERYVNNIELPITKEFVLIPAGLPLDSLSAPITNPAARAMIMSIKNSSCRPICQFSNILSGIYKSIYNPITIDIKQINKIIYEFVNIFTNMTDWLACKIK